MIPRVDHSFLLGLIGTVLGVVSFTWQVAAWKMSGARLSVCFVWGIPIKSVKFGSMDEHLGIKVTHRGRISTRISGVSCRLPSGKQFALIADAFDQIHFPREIHPGESVTAYFEVGAIEHALAENGLPETTRLKPQVSSGHGDVRGRGIVLS